MDSLGRYLLHKRLGLIATGLDLIDEFSGFLRIFSGQLHVLTCLDLDFAESREAEIAGNNGDDTEQGQEDGRGGEPPIDCFFPMIQQFAPKFVETS